MKQSIGIGIQDFEKIRKRNLFYIDKTDFIKEWWENNDDVTLITRPRRFGKTLTMSMIEKFFSVVYKGRDDLFENLSIWKDEDYKKLQGTYPVISLSLASVKENNFQDAYNQICQLLSDLYNHYAFLKRSGLLEDGEFDFFERAQCNMGKTEAVLSLHHLSDYMSRYYGKKVIILLDEYDTPMQEAWVNGYWEELASFTRSLFDASFKTNPYLERGLMTGITRVGKESIFSGLNNLKIVSVTSDSYASAFGFTEKEVFDILDEYGMPDKKEDIKKWYDGFSFGKEKDIYNPWSIINYLNERALGTYWVNTSSNSLVEKLLREGSSEVKKITEDLLKGKSFVVEADEQIAFNQLDGDEDAIWSLLLASGYLRVEGFSGSKYRLKLTNWEIKDTFERMVRSWFKPVKIQYSEFIEALLSDDLDAMNKYMNIIAAKTFSFFDTGKSFSGEPEKFYHGFVLGLLVDLEGRYIVTSNRESGYGRYDVMLEPVKKEDNAYILEFKVKTSRESLEEAVFSALKQIEEKQYETALTERGISPNRIKKYGFAFEGKKVLIGNTDSGMGFDVNSTWNGNCTTRMDVFR